MTEKITYSEEELNSLAKERPRNETSKRFVLSKEQFSRERLNAVKEEVDELQRKYPEVLSLCLFGSMVKGTAHEGSDIDGYLYIDSALIAQKEGVPEEEVLEKHSTRNETYLKQEIARSYVTELRTGIQEKTGLKDEDVKHVRSSPISEKVIDNGIDATLDYYKKKEAYLAGLDAYHATFDHWLRSKPPQGSEVDVLLAYEKQKPERPKSPDPVSTNFGSMFHLEVGGGIRPYRKMLLKKLVDLGPAGEQVWADIIRSTEMMENNLSTDKNKRYPRTLADAVKQYAQEN